MISLEELTRIQVGLDKARDKLGETTLVRDFSAVVEAAYACRQALEFYADEKNWISPSTGMALQIEPVPGPARDRGARARAVLEIKE